MLNADEIRLIGVELHKDCKKRWEVHPMMVKNYMIAFFFKKDRFFSMDEMIVKGYYNMIEKIAYGHDLLKKIKGHHVISIDDSNYIIDIDDDKQALLGDDLNKMLKEILPKLGLNDEQISEVAKDLVSVGSYHGVNSAAWLYSQGEVSSGVLVPIMMHQCPVPSLYQLLPEWLQELCDITILADKCSKNVLKAYVFQQAVPVMLVKSLFGNDGTEFNFTSSLLLARIIQQGNKPNDIQKSATKMFRARCKNLGLPVPKKCRLDIIDKHFIPEEREKNEVKEALMKQYGNFYNEISGANSNGEGSEKSDGAIDQSSSG